jgi:predicted metal-dependent phosphoesterase TrpH
VPQYDILTAVENPFESPGTWLRCALHAHTTNSDGELPPEMLVRHYDRAGFDVLAITDHWVRTVVPSTERLLVIPSVELDARTDGRGGAHVLALGVAADPVEPGSQMPTLDETVSWITASGGVPYLAHTYWSGLRAEAFEACQGLVGLEVYNAACELEIGRGLATLHWDEVLEGRRACFGLATDDSHQPGFDSSLAWVWARCEERSEEAVLAALRDGLFYSSTGPEIHELAVTERAVELRCSPARSITLLAGRMKGASINAGRLGYSCRSQTLETDDRGLVTAARLDRPPFTPYGRVELRDADGKRAWTNPLWVS